MTKDKRQIIFPKICLLTSPGPYVTQSSRLALLCERDQCLHTERVGTSTTTYHIGVRVCDMTCDITTTGTSLRQKLTAPRTPYLGSTGTTGSRR
jgi:hypothetical protein